MIARSWPVVLRVRVRRVLVRSWVAFSLLARLLSLAWLCRAASVLMIPEFWCMLFDDISSMCLFFMRGMLVRRLLLATAVIRDVGSFSLFRLWFMVLGLTLSRCRVLLPIIRMWFVVLATMRFLWMVRSIVLRRLRNCVSLWVPSLRALWCMWWVMSYVFVFDSSVVVMLGSMTNGYRVCKVLTMCACCSLIDISLCIELLMIMGIMVCADGFSDFAHLLIMRLFVWVGVTALMHILLMSVGPGRAHWMLLIDTIIMKLALALVCRCLVNVVRVVVGLVDVSFRCMLLAVVTVCVMLAIRDVVLRLIRWLVRMHVAVIDSSMMSSVIVVRMVSIRVVMSCGCEDLVNTTNIRTFLGGACGDLRFNVMRLRFE